MTGSKLRFIMYANNSNTVFSLEPFKGRGRGRRARAHTHTERGRLSGAECLISQTV